MQLSTRAAEESSLSSRSTAKRLYQLDSLRGLAALTVLFHHLRLATNYRSAPWYSAPLFAGESAVCLFFVLSGYVLTSSLWNNSRETYPLYALRRIIRIWLPFAAAATLSMAGAQIFWGRHPALSKWFSLTWQQPVTIEMALKQYFMWPLFTFNTAFWSLHYEMAISFVLPAALWIMRKTHPVAITCGLIFAGYVSPDFMWKINGPQRVGEILQVLGFFCLGTCLCIYKQPISDIFAKMSGTFQVFFLLSSLLIYNGYQEFVRSATLSRILFGRTWLFYAVGASMTIICCVEMPLLTKALRTGWIEYLGRISYSLYLTHSVVLFISFDLLFGKMSLIAIRIIIVVGSLAVAHLFCVFVEEPSIGLSKWLKERQMVNARVSGAA